jgi:hypothetical protein
MWGCLCPITCLFTSWKLLYWTMKETNHSRRYSKGDRLKYGAQMLIKEFISGLKKAFCFFAVRTDLSSLSTFRCVSNKLCFVMSSVLPSSVSDSKQTDFLPTQCRRTTPDFVKMFWFWFSLVHYKNRIIAWKKQLMELINHVGSNIHYTITVSQYKQLHIYTNIYFTLSGCYMFRLVAILGELTTKHLRTRSNKLVLKILRMWGYRLC